MTISSQNRKAGPFVGNDSTTAFPFAFKVFTAADLYVVLTDTTLGTDTVLVLNTDYTVSLNANQNSNPGGTVTLPSALAEDFNLTITSSLQYLQPTDLTNQGGFYPSVITNALDRLTIFCQQLYDAVNRSLKISVSTPAGVSTTLPPPASNKIISWNEAADALQNMDPSTLATIVAFGTANADKFDGDGVTTQFVLSDDPGALNNLDVSIGGVTQTPGIDYSWTSGTTITFTTAPPVGTDNVLVRYMQGLPQGTTDSAASTYLPAGTGAVATTVQTKLRESVSIKDFGAVGDGITDDTAEIQAALNSGAKTIYVPQGNYVFTALTVPQRVELIGDGPDSTFLSTTTTGNAVSIGERNTFKNLTIRQTSGTKQGKGLVGSDKYWLMTENIKVLGFDYNLYCDKALYHSHKQSWFEGGNYGVYYWGAAGTWNIDWFNNVLTFDTCRFNGNTNIGTYVKGTEVVFINPDWSGMSATNSIGLRVVGESAGQPAHGIKIIAPYAETTDIVFSFLYAYADIDGGFVQGGTAAGASAFTSVIDADNSQVWWNGRMRDQDYWDNGYRLTNSSKLVFEYGFSGSVIAGNSVDATSKAITVQDYEEGTFTATLTGCTTSPTATAYYIKNGKQVTISIPAVNGTSNSAASGLSGLPAALYPARDQLMFGAFFNDGGETNGIVRVQSSGAINFYPTVFGTNFVASGLKGNRTLSLAYSLY